MTKTAIRNAKVVNEGQIWEGDILIGDDRIIRLGSFDVDPELDIDIKGDFILPGVVDDQVHFREPGMTQDRKSTRLNSSHVAISYAVFCLKKKKNRDKSLQYTK